MYNVGIDWSREFHVTCITDENGKKCDTFRIEHSEKGFQELLKNLEIFGKEVRIGIEAHNGLLVDFLLNRGYELYVLNPKSVDRYRDRISVSGAKDDERDAYVIAEAIRTDFQRMKPVKPNSDITQELREIARNRKYWVEMRVSAINRLRDVLLRYYPQANHIYDDMSHPFVLEYLNKWPSPSTAKKAKLKHVEAMVNKYHLNSVDAKALQEKMGEFSQGVRPGVESACIKMVKGLIREIGSLNQEIKDYDDRLKELLEKHPSGKVIQSIPGIGSTLGSQILGEIADDLSAYDDNHHNMAAYGGVAPITKQSGKLKARVQIRRACNGYLRNSLFLWAKSLLRVCPKSYKYFITLRENNSEYGTSLRKLAHRWLPILFSVVRTGKPFDKELFAKKVFGPQAKKGCGKKHNQIELQEKTR